MPPLSDRLRDAFDNPAKALCRDGNLRVLRDAGLVESSRRGTWVYYRLVPETVEALRGTLGG